MNFLEYEKQCAFQQEKNEEYLKIFKKELEKAKTAKRSIANHLTNVDFYINNYLLRFEPLPMNEGCKSIDDFLGYFYIYKCIWSNPTHIKITAISIKKFYKCMFKHGFVSLEEYQCLCDTIDNNMDNWVKECSKYKVRIKDFI